MFHQLSLSVELFGTTGAIIFLGSLGFSLVFGISWHFFVLFMNLHVADQVSVLAEYTTTYCTLILFDSVVHNFHMPSKIN